MPNPARALARLTAQTQSWDPRISGNDPARLTAADIALAAAHIQNPLAYQWLLVRYVDHVAHKDILKLRDMIVDELRQHAKGKGWRARENGPVPKLQRLASLWIAETLNPHRCRVCKGLGQVFDLQQKTHVSCPACGGRCVERWSNAERAQWLGIWHTAFNRTWRPRLQQIERIMGYAQEEAFRSIGRALS